MSNPKIRIEMLPAGSGDCFLVHFGEIVWLIDSGFIKQTYDNILRSRLQKLHERNQSISKMIITHIDRDHISGAVRLLEENKSAEIHQIIAIDQIWHNSYRHISFEDKQSKRLPQDLIEDLKKRAQKNHLSFDDENHQMPAGAKQGSTLAYHIYKGAYPWNTESGGKAISVEHFPGLPSKSDIQLTLLTPNEDLLKKLGIKWRKKLRDIYKGPIDNNPKFDEVLEFLMAEDLSPISEGIPVSSGNQWIKEVIRREAEYKEDTSVANGSSISFLVEYAGKKLLFLGDARPSSVVSRLKDLFPGISREAPLHVDAIKLAHHGSFKSNSPELLQLVSAGKYLISTSGSTYFHPHLETLAWILHSHPQVHKKLYFNYDHGLKKKDLHFQPPRLSRILDTKLQSKYNYEIVLPTQGTSGIEIKID